MQNRRMSIIKYTLFNLVIKYTLVNLKINLGYILILPKLYFFFMEPCNESFRNRNYIIVNIYFVVYINALLFLVNLI